MHDGRNEDPIFLPCVKNCEREAKDKPPANAGPFDWACIQELLDSARCLFDRRDPSISS